MKTQVVMESTTLEFDSFFEFACFCFKFVFSMENMAYKIFPILIGAFIVYRLVDDGLAKSKNSTDRLPVWYVLSFFGMSILSVCKDKLYITNEILCKIIDQYALVTSINVVLVIMPLLVIILIYTAIREIRDYFLNKVEEKKKAEKERRLVASLPTNHFYKKFIRRF